MSIDTSVKRNSAFIEECGILLPVGSLALKASRETMVGQYLPGGEPPPVTSGNPAIVYGSHAGAYGGGGSIIRPGRW